MRWFAYSLMALAAFMIGCNEPVETIPSVTPSSATTDVDDHADHDHADDHDHDGEEHAEGDVDAVAPESTDTPATPEAAEPAEEAAEVPAADVSEAPEADDAAAPEGEPNAAKGSGELIRFVADKKLNVPNMMCPYSCWPKVKETLSAQPGVEDVQLAEQPKDAAEGEIVERVVELKLNGDFDADKAIAALEKADFKAELVN